MMALAFGHYVHPDDIPTEASAKSLKPILTRQLQMAAKSS